MYIVLKVILTTGLVFAVSEIARRSSLIGGIVASLPLVSLLAMIWLYVDTRSVEKVAALSGSIFWMVLPSLSLFVLLPVLLKRGLGFYASLAASVVVMVALYGATIFLLRRGGVSV